MSASSASSAATAAWAACAAGLPFGSRSARLTTITCFTGAAAGYARTPSESASSHGL